MSDQTDDLLRALICVTGRAAIPADQLRALVTGGRDNAKHIRAYNLCDGRLGQAAIAKRAGLDRGNFSRTVQRWEREGIVFRVGEDGNLVHLYPLY